jgi:hypothetical protein
MMNDLLDKIRQRLLDLSKRNQFLNYREKARTVQLGEIPIDKLFEKLVREGQSLTLLARPEVKPPLTNFVINVSRETLPPLPVINVGSETLPPLISPPLPVTKPKKSPETLPTIHNEDLLARRCQRLAQESRTAIEETGSNLLYLAMGFLEWYEANDDPKANQAPLILIPVKLERAPLPRVTTYTYLLSYREEEIKTNLSLSEKLTQDYNLKLPDFSEDLEPAAYLAQVYETLNNLPRWQVVPDLRIDFFSFTKLLIYKDLDNDNWPEAAKLTDNVNLQQILLGPTPPSPMLDSAVNSAIDTDPLADQTPLILDADSSQQRVIMDALWKKSHLVVEGPPGTGKSQTITNLIAAAMSQGQTVLFVAEKKAALEVVKARLDYVGLGEFCLELHSHKTQKTELHATLKKRLDTEYPNVSSLERELKELTALKQKLLAYSQRVSTVVGPHDEKVYEIFWIIERLRSELSGQPFLLEIEKPRQFSRPRFDHSVAKLTELAAHYQTLPKDAIQLWQGFQPVNVLPGDEEIIQKILTTMLLDAQEYKAYLDVLLEETKLPVEQNLETFHSLADIDVSCLHNLPKAITAALAMKMLDPVAVTQVKQFQIDRNEYQQLVTQAFKVLGRDPLSGQLIQQLAKAAKKLEDWGFGNDSPNDLNYFIQSLDKMNEELQLLLHHSDSIGNFLNFLKLRELAVQSPRDLVLNKHPDHALEATKFIFEHARQTFTALAKQWHEQSNFFLLNKLPSVETIAVLSDELRKHRGHWWSFLSSDYRQAKREINRFLLSPTLFKSPELPERLHVIATLKQQITQESQREPYRQTLGPLFVGLATDWEHLAQHLHWAQRLSELLGTEDQAKELLSSQADPSGYIFKSTAVMYEQWLRVEKVAKQLKIAVASHFHVKTFVEKLLERRQAVAELVIILQQLPTLSDKPIISIQAATQNLLTAGKIRATVERHPGLSKIFGKLYQGIQTDPTLVVAVANWIIQLKNSKLPQPLLQWLVSDPIARGGHCQKLFIRNHNYLAKFVAVCNKLTAFGEFDPQQWLNCEGSQCTLTHIAHHAHTCQTWVRVLPAYATVYRLKQAADEMGLAPFTQALVSQTLPPDQLALHFQYSLYHSIARELLRHSPELANFTRTGHENLRQRFTELDQQILQTTRTRLAYQIARRPIPEGNGTGKVGTYTDKCLIEHELNKKKRHIPIRQLVRRAGPALQAMKPCFMMSPLSVVQYLPPGEIEFDLLIFDEASQVRPEEALSAIARSQQIVIVGDPKQLPPTSFFERLTDSEADKQLMAFEGQESILDLCLATYPRRRLRWHYRSEHESLIAFSNHYFYDDDLMVFPSPQAKSRESGVHHHYVENATYYKGRNLLEAETVVDAVMAHFRNSPQLSLGVATFNLDQQELITDVLEKRSREDTWLETQLKVTEDTPEPFFVKNLENVQGDERDVILVSTTYGPDPHTGRVYQRFGPIASELGWRRLNVIFTRARKRLELFTSMRSSDIASKADAKQGVRTLKAYLEYAETGWLPDSSPVTQQPFARNDFEIAIGNLLQEHGYSTVPQVGVAGLRLDLGVCHPARPNEYLLGIESDGVAYHSAQSVRDRDRLRPTILESKGWKIHRLWSTDWFNHREAEIDRLLKALSVAKTVPQREVVVQE